MDPNYDVAVNNTSFDSHKDIIAKGLNTLFVCQIASLAVTALGIITPIASIVGWVSRIISIIVIVALFKLAAVHERYRKAAIFHSISVGGGIVSALINMNILGIALSVCSIIASYQQLTAHAEITAPKSPRLSGKWRSLFYCQLVIGLISGFVSSAGVVIAVLADVNPDSIVSVTLIFITLVNIVLGLFHIMYLKLTLALYRD